MIALGSELPAYYFSPTEKVATTRGVVLDSDWHTYRLAVEKNTMRLYIDGSEVTRATDNRLLTAGDAGIWCSGDVQIGVRSFKIVPLGDSAVSAEDNEIDDLVVAGEDIQDIFSLLPTANEAPPGLILSEERQRSLDEVSEAFSNPEEAVQRFQEWGWQENAYREFAPPNGEPLSPLDLDYARVGIHRFGGVSQSAAAADYIAQDVVAGIGGGGGPGPDIGDGSILLSGQNQNGNWVNLLVYQGPYLISVSTSSPQGDPAGAAFALADAVLAKVGQSPSG